MTETAVLSAWRRFGRPHRVGVAFSGGGDSTALLVAACAVSQAEGFFVHAIHIDHALRAESAGEAAWCQAFSGDLGIACDVHRLDSENFEGNTHDAARRARYAAFEQSAEEHDLNTIWTAHTAEDQAETLLQRIARGTGPAGLAGIRERFGIIARPLLHARREHLRDYLRAGGFTWLEDPSNADSTYMRTRLRSSVLPALVALGEHDAVAAIGRLAELAAEQNDLVADLTAADFAVVAERGGLRVDSLRALPAARRANVLRHWLAERAIVPPRQVIGDLLHLVDAPGPAGPVDLPGGGAIARDYEWLNWKDTSVVYTSWEPFEADRLIQRTFAGGRLTLTVTDNAPELVPGDVFLAPGRLAGAVWKTAWPGARMTPVGMDGHVKLQDLFVNEKIPRELRSVWPILARGTQILLVPGLRVAKALKSHQENEKTWVVRFKWL
jgi:tRNA(Ile)-lysidine synthase